MLFNIHELIWDKELCSLLHIPENTLPRVCSSAHDFGTTHSFLPLCDGIPITAMIGDQQSALFGQGCFAEGQVKNTYGTGCFIMMPTPGKAVITESGLLTTVGCGESMEPLYALEGSVFIGGAVIQWLRDELRIINTAEESESIAREVESSEGVICVPAFVGLGAPYWDSEARGALLGLTRGSGRGQITRAALESIAYQSAEVLLLMEQVSGIDLQELKVDGGACKNDLLMQFQSDIMNIKISRPQNIETTALGAGLAAGIKSGYWNSYIDVASQRKPGKNFISQMNQITREKKMQEWKKAVKMVIT